MIRLSLLIIGLFSFIYGSIFLLFPYWFADITQAQKINIAWLRNLGASIMGILFFGCIYIYYNMKGKLVLLRIIAVTSIIQTLALIYSRIYNEFSAKNLLMIDLSIFIAIFICIYFAWLINYKSYDFR